MTQQPAQQVVVRYHPKAEDQVRADFPEPEHRLVEDATVPEHEAYRMEFPEPADEGFRPPLDVSAPVEAVNEAAGGRRPLLEAVHAPQAPQEAAQEPQQGPEPGAGRTEPVAMPASLFDVARSLPQALQGAAVDGVERVRSMVKDGVNLAQQPGEKVTYFVIPTVAHQQDGSMVTLFSVTLSMPGPLVGQQTNLGALINDLFPAREAVEGLARQMLEQLRSMQHAQREAMLAAAQQTMGPVRT